MRIPDIDKFSLNNFDLLRLCAALQVATHHAFEVMHIEAEGWVRIALQVTKVFPGVPIFFFISGYLISRSFENNTSLFDYFRNRVLRLYPGLICAVLLSIFFLYSSGYVSSITVNFSDLVVLFIAKSTFVQFYNPDFMRAYGDGVLNGSLWTITVELQFYVLVPLLYWVLRPIESAKSNGRLITLIAVFFFLNRVYNMIPTTYQQEVIYKLVRVSFIPWFYMFLLGVLAQRNFEIVYRIIGGRFVLFLLGYCVVGLLGLYTRLSFENNPNPIVFSFLVLVVLSFAYSFPTLSKKLLRGNDISYGMYIYHMPVVNVMVYKGLKGDIFFLACAVFTVVLLSALSWRMLERPSLGLKRVSLKPILKPSPQGQKA